MTNIIGLFLVTALCVPTAGDDLRVQPAPLYRVTVVGRTTRAVNYGYRSAPTRIDFRGTVLLPESKGEATVESKRGIVEIHARFKHLDPPARFGREYLTYVLWALTPEGRATNLGELLTDEDDKGRVKVTTELQAFALVVTAEPHFAVTQMSNVVVMENVLRKDTVGRVEAMNAKYDLLQRGSYTLHLEPAAPDATGEKVSLEKYGALLALYQARNAVQIARAQGADQHAGETLRRAEQLLREAETHQSREAGARIVVTTARQATQTAEDARAIAAKRHPTW